MKLNPLQLVTFQLLLATLGWSASSGKAKPGSLLLKDFPRGIGCQWVYACVDSSSSGRRSKWLVVTDTVKVKVVGQTPTADGHTAGIWVREFRSKTDTQYVELAGDTLSFTKRRLITADTINPLHEEELYRFVFPLRAGIGWFRRYHFIPPDSYSVTRDDSIEVAPHEFRPGFLVKQSPPAGNEAIDVSYSIVPGTGLVRMEIRDFLTFGDSHRVRIWKLISCVIKK